MSADHILYRINDKFTSLLDIVYPVGSIYISIVDTSPAELFGGTWEKIEGYFLRAGADTATGGSDTKTLSVDNLPAHAHSIDHNHYMQHYHHITDAKLPAYNAGGWYSLSGDHNTNWYAWADTQYGGLVSDTGGSRDWTENANGNWSGNTGSGAAFDVMPQYKNVHVWQRIE